MQILLWVFELKRRHIYISMEVWKNGSMEVKYFH